MSRQQRGSRMPLLVAAPPSTAPAKDLCQCQVLRPRLGAARNRSVLGSLPLSEHPDRDREQSDYPRTFAKSFGYRLFICAGLSKSHCSPILTV